MKSFSNNYIDYTSPWIKATSLILACFCFVCCYKQRFLMLILCKLLLINHISFFSLPHLQIVCHEWTILAACVFHCSNIAGGGWHSVSMLYFNSSVVLVYLFSRICYTQESQIAFFTEYITQAASYSQHYTTSCGFLGWKRCNRYRQA